MGIFSNIWDLVDGDSDDDDGMDLDLGFGFPVLDAIDTIEDTGGFDAIKEGVKDLINPFDGSNPLLDGAKDLGLGNAFPILDVVDTIKQVGGFDGMKDLIKDIINPFDGSNPILDAITGGGGKGGGGKPLQGGGGTAPLPVCALPEGDCYQKCQQNDVRLRTICQQLTDSHIAKLKMIGCDGITCNVPDVSRSCY